MERLTTKRKDGRWALKNDDGATPWEQINKVPRAIDRLAAYEDTGLEPEEIIELRQAWYMYGGEEGINSFLEELECRRAEQLNDPMALADLREMDGPVWVECGITPFTPNGGYYCLCQNGRITAPSGMQYIAEDIPHWKFYRRKP